MKRTLDEKLKYNEQRYEQCNDSFSLGYRMGVTLYRDYRKFNNEAKETVKSIIVDNKQFARTGDRTAKGIMCGVRDAANERKGK